MSNITEICKIAMVVQNEAGLGLETSATIAERLYEEGCRILPVVEQNIIPEGEWKEIDYSHNIVYCTNCQRTVKMLIRDDTVQYAFCPCCGSKNSR